MEDSLLHDFVEEVSGRNHLRVEHDFGDGFVRLHTSEAERRQAAQDIRCSEDVLFELIRNSRDAHSAHIFIATGREGNLRTLTVIDDGEGIPSSMHGHIFEPRVTSKLDTSHKDAWGLHGRGMALFSIKENARSAQVVTSRENLGSVIQVTLDSQRLPEKTDQSSFPSFVLQEQGKVNVRGPRNLLRTACEFALETRNECSVYMGSNAEVAAALYDYGRSTLSALDRVFCKNRDELPLTKVLATATDPADLAALATSLGLAISERTARRIIDGHIASALPLLDRVVIADSSAPKPKTRKAARPKALSLTNGDKQALSQAALEAFEPLAEEYYLESAVEPKVSVGSESITIAIPIVRTS